MATRDDLLYSTVGGFRKYDAASGMAGLEVRLIGKYSDGDWAPDAGTECNELFPQPAVLELVVERDIEDEDIEIQLGYCPVSFTGYTNYSTNLGAYDIKTYGWCPQVEQVTYTIPAFTRAGKIIVEDDDGNQCVDFGKFMGVSLTGGNGTVSIHEIMTEGGKLVQALKPIGLMDVLYKLKQSVSKGPRPCPRCGGYGADSDYQDRLEARIAELVAEGYSPSSALIYAQEEVKTCQLCEGKHFVVNDYDIAEFLLDDFLKWQGAPYSGASMEDKIGMAFVCNLQVQQSESCIKKFLATIFDVAESSVLFSKDVGPQNIVCYIGFKGEPGPNALLHDRTYLQWVLDSIRPAGIEYFAADSVTDIEEDWNWIDTLDEFLLDEGTGEEFTTNYFDEVPGTWFAISPGEQFNRFEDKFDASMIKGYELHSGPSHLDFSSKEGYEMYHGINAIYLPEGMVVGHTWDFTNMINADWEITFMLMPIGGTAKVKLEVGYEPR
jgi:hypothetical protein